MLLVVGLVLIVLGVLSRLFGLGVYGRLTQTLVRRATPSAIPGAPWFSLASDRVALRMIVYGTYAAVLGGTVLFIAGVLFGT